MVATSDITFGDMLRQLRVAAQLTQEGLATRAKVAVRTISDLERGVAKSPHRDTLSRLVQGLELTGPTEARFEAAARGRAFSAESAASPAGTPMRTLPRDITSFVGRDSEFRRLADAADGGGVVRIYAIGGMAGIGKTAFAVHAAHRLAKRFPDGQLFISLHGHTPGRRPVDSVDALASLLRTAGVDVGRLLPDLEALARLWRDLLTDKRLLIILDDATGSEQIGPLLPGSGGCLVLVTSRRHLTALDDAPEISLDILSPNDAIQLVIRLADREDMDADDPAIAEIAQLCGYLPLAAGMLGRQLHHHPAWTPASLAAELADAEYRLGLIQAENRSVAAAFDLSYADLTHDQQRFFRRLGVHPGTDTDAWAAAALDGTDLATARRHLQALYDQYLITEPAHGRFRMHDLIREHARALAALDPVAGRDAALGRLLDYYQRTAAFANALVADTPRARPGTNPPESTLIPTPSLRDRARALSWLRAERASLFACLDHMTREGQNARTLALTAALATLLRQDGPWAEAIARHDAAVDAARSLGDRLGQAAALHELGAVRRLTGDYPRAVEAQEEALGIYRELGNRPGQASALNDLGAVRYQRGDYPGATEALDAALHINRELGNRPGQASALSNLGVVRWLTGDYPGALQALDAALGIYSDLGNRPGQASALSDLGAVRYLTGDYLAAADALGVALDIYRDLGNRLGQASALSNLGAVWCKTADYPAAAEALETALDIYLDLGNRLGQASALSSLGAARRLTRDYPGAAEALDVALDICKDLGNLGGEAEVLNELGTLHRERGDLNLATACHQQALGLARRIGSSSDEASANAGLGRCALAVGRTAEGIANLRRAQEIFRRIGAAEATTVTAELNLVSARAPGR